MSLIRLIERIRSKDDAEFEFSPKAAEAEDVCEVLELSPSGGTSPKNIGA